MQISFILCNCCLLAILSTCWELGTGRTRANHTVQMKTLTLRWTELFFCQSWILSPEWADVTIVTVIFGLKEAVLFVLLMTGLGKAKNEYLLAVQDFWAQSGNFIVLGLEFHGMEWGNFWELAELFVRQNMKVKRKRKCGREERARVQKGWGFCLGQCRHCYKGRIKDLVVGCIKKARSCLLGWKVNKLWCHRDLRLNFNFINTGFVL